MSDEPPLIKLSRPAPARGAVAGIRQDIQIAKATGEMPSKGGWSHKFLNKKPWHPNNFRNRTRVYEAEQRHMEAEAMKAKEQEEFKAEQEYLKTISMLSPEEQEKYRQRQSVSWLYQKPPGYDTVQQKQQQAQNGDKNPPLLSFATNASDGASRAAAEANRGTAGANGSNNKEQKGGSYVKKVLGGVQAMVQQQTQLYELKEARPLGMSPPRGAIDPLAENQKLVVGVMDSYEEEEAYRLALMSEEEKKKLEKEMMKRRRRAEKEQQRIASEAEKQRVKAAKDYLREVGISVPESSSSDDNNSPEMTGEEGFERRNSKRRQKERQHRKQKRRKKSKKK